MDLIRKVFEAKVKAQDDEKLIVEHFISTETVDRHGDIVRASGMRIKGKPVVLLQHGRGHMGAEPIAKPVRVTRGEFKGEKGVIASTQFFPDDLGKRLYEKTSGGFMPNWSIGFIPIKTEPRKDADGNPTEGRDIKTWELLEYSIVGVPAQPDAQTIPGKKDEDGFESITFKMISRDEASMGEHETCPDCNGPLAVEHDFELAMSGGPIEVVFCPACREKAATQKLFDGPDWEKEASDEDWDPGDEKPYPNEHACRVADPAGFDKFRRQNNKFGAGIHAIWGVKAGKSALQAVRFASDKFTAAQAKKWLSDHDQKCISFEAATGKTEEVGQTLEKLSADIRMLSTAIATMGDALKTTSEQVATLKEGFDVINKVLEDNDFISVTEPAAGDPDPTLTNNGNDNPPEQGKGIPKLVFVEKKRGNRKRDEIIEVITEVLDNEFIRRYRKEILGKVD